MRRYHPDRVKYDRAIQLRIARSTAISGTPVVKASKCWDWQDRLRVIEAIAKRGRTDTYLAPTIDKLGVIALLTTSTPETLEANRAAIERQGNVKLCEPEPGAEGQNG